MEILEQIASQFGMMGQESVSGVIYFHSIQNPRLTGADKANFRILKAICGEYFSHVAFVTSFWDRVDLLKHGKEFNNRNYDLELERRHLLPKSPRIFRFLNDSKSHKIVLDYFAAQVKPAGPAPPQLLFAEELKRYQYEKKPTRAVRKTAAGKQMMAELKKVSGGFSRSIHITIITLFYLV